MESLLIGRTVADRYLVESVLGRGGMSVVYRAVDNRLGRPVALKIVAYPADMSPEERPGLRERLRREAAAAATLSSHPNVVQVYDHGTDPELDLDFITMELLTGADLKQLLKEGPLGVGEAITILQAAARGVAAGHRAGIVHRDVKPANIFLSRGGDSDAVKVLDFGIAKALEPGLDEDLTQHDRIPHSPAYASPEQLEGAPLTPASDVYQLGLIGYEMLAGERPFSEEDRRRIGLNERVPIPEVGRWGQIPANVRDVIERALDRRPERRFPDAVGFAGALDAEAEDDATVMLDATSVLNRAPATYASAPARDAAPSPPRTASPARRPTRSPAGPRRGAVHAAYAVAFAILAILAWRLVSPTEEAAVVADPVPAAEEGEIANIDDLHAEFRPLLIEAVESLSDVEPPTE